MYISEGNDSYHNNRGRQRRPAIRRTGLDRGRYMLTIFADFREKINKKGKGQSPFFSDATHEVINEQKNL